MAYIGLAKPQKLIDELMKEMLSIETVNSNVERTDEPPYFQLFDRSKSSEVSADIGSMASLIHKMHNHKEKNDGSDKSGSADKEKASSEKGFRDIGSNEKATQVHVQSLIPGKGSPGQNEEVWKERDKSSRSVHCFSTKLPVPFIVNIYLQAKPFIPSHKCVSASMPHAYLTRTHMHCAFVKPC